MPLKGATGAATFYPYPHCLFPVAAKFDPFGCNVRLPDFHIFPALTEIAAAYVCKRQRPANIGNRSMDHCDGELKCLSAAAVSSGANNLQSVYWCRKSDTI